MTMNNIYVAHDISQTLSGESLNRNNIPYALNTTSETLSRYLLIELKQNKSKKIYELRLDKLK